jgi:RNA polymerase primary sigma factor
MATTEDDRANPVTQPLRWGFRPLSDDGGLDYGNANIWAFDPSLDTFAREVTQNSVDAALESRVDLVFRLHVVRGQRLTRFKEALQWKDLEQHLEAAADPSQKFGRTLQRGLDELERSDELIALCIEERGTKGLVGREKGKDSHFAALCRNNLDSQKTSAAGGAFGLGKAVLWRASSLSTVLFHSHLSTPVDDDPQQQYGRLLGRTELAYHALGEGEFAGPGWFGREASDGSAVSAWDADLYAGPLLLERKTLGFGIVGFQDPTSDEEPNVEATGRRLLRAVATHFWPALEEDKLSATVEIDEGSAPLVRLPVTPALVVPEYVDMLRRHNTDDVVDLLERPGDVARRVVPLQVPAAKGGHEEFQHEAILLVRRADPSEQGGTELNKVAFVRGARMVVEYRGMGSVGLGARPFHAVVLCGHAAEHKGIPEIDDDEADRLAAEEFLRVAEPPSHNTWTLTPDLKAQYARGAGARLEDFRGAIKGRIRELVTPQIKEASDAPRDLLQLLRMTVPPEGERRPQIFPEETFVDDEGRWDVTAVLNVKPPEGKRWRGRPVVVFNGETGGGRMAPLELLEALDNCMVDPDDSDKLIVASGKRRARFRVVTDAAKQPLPASDSTISLQFRSAEKVSP